MLKKEKNNTSKIELTQWTLFANVSVGFNYIGAKWAWLALLQTRIRTKSSHLLCRLQLCSRRTAHELVALKRLQRGCIIVCLHNPDTTLHNDCWNCAWPQLWVIEICRRQ